MFVAFEWTQRDVKIDTSQAVADLVFEPSVDKPTRNLIFNVKKEKTNS